MDVSLFDYDLPQEAIAQVPHPKGTSRMMILPLEREGVIHTSVDRITDYLQPGEILVLNNSRVIPARIFGTLPTGGKLEVLFTRELKEGRWRVLTRPARKARKGTKISLPRGAVISVEAELEQGAREVAAPPDIRDVLRREGHMPLPPYIKRPDTPEDREWYQTIYAEVEGSVAAPTAGLHFTDEILETVAQKGVRIVPITLHVSIGTFRPVSAEDTRDHVMDEEFFTISQESAEALNLALDEKRRIIAVGTTSVRTLEAAIRQGEGRFRPGEYSTDLFITPGFSFQAVNGMLTNFHLPRSSLLMLVSTLAGRERIIEAYRQALEEGYRFFSYGDCMLIL